MAWLHAFDLCVRCAGSLNLNLSGRTLEDFQVRRSCARKREGCPDTRVLSESRRVMKGVYALWCVSWMAVCVCVRVHVCVRAGDAEAAAPRGSSQHPQRRPRPPCTAARPPGGPGQERSLGRECRQNAALD
eukprot:359932-Rhodomonas_salina.1